MTENIFPYTTIAQYTIVSKLGEGGMGVVYRARDNKLAREVAIKVLPASLSANADRLNRFEQEAQAAGALNHPNILSIYHIGTHEGAPYIVSELLEGETLRDRLAGGALPQRKAIDYALHIAKGLAAAHEKGIIHRDIKPDNIFITEDGRVKILDFGLAKLTGPVDGVESQTEVPTRKVNTDPGAVMGTMGYMSPEQLKGKQVDHRSDIFSFGAILYEMLSGKRAFRGDSMAETMSAILREDPPDLSETNKTISPALERVVRHCLEKNPGERFHSASDLSFAVEALSGGATNSGQSPTLTMPAVDDLPNAKTWTNELFWKVSAVVLAALLMAFALFVFLRPNPRVEAVPLVRYEVDPLDQTYLTLIRYPTVAISPDGATLALTATKDGVSRLYVRKRDETELREIPGTEGASDVAFSPNGQQIAFFANFALKKVLLAGQVDTIATTGDPRGLSWKDDNTVVYAPHATSEIVQVSASGGSPMPITTILENKAERTHRWPQVLPGGKAVICTVGTLDKPDDYDGSNIEAVILATGERRQVLQGASMARYVSGCLLFAREGVIYAVKFDPDRLTVQGNTVAVLRGVAGDKTTGAVHFSIADDGTLAYVPGNTTSGARHLFWLEKNGSKTPLDVANRQLNDPRISPDGSRLLLLQGSSNSGDVWIFDFARTTFTRFTFTGTNATPIWSPDGKDIYYCSIDPVLNETTIYRRPADGSREAEVVNKVESNAYLKAILPDGKSAILDDKMHTSRADISRVELRSGAGKVGVVESPFNEFAAALSPDGQWLAYQSNESGPPEIYVRNLGSGGRTQISSAGGEEPHWGPGGRELYYRNGSSLLVVPINLSTTLQVGTPKSIFNEAFDLRSNSGETFDVNPRDGRILMIQPVKEAGTAKVNVVVNWFGELRRLLSGK